METNETVASTPSPKKKGFGSVFLIICIVGIILWFGGHKVYELVSVAPKVDSIAKVDTAAVKAKVDTAITKFESAVRADSVKNAVIGDTVKKVVNTKK